MKTSKGIWISFATRAHGRIRNLMQKVSYTGNGEMQEQDGSIKWVMGKLAVIRKIRICRIIYSITREAYKQDH